MAMLGEPVITDSEGNTHRWADELGAHLTKIQKEDGSWRNEASRWYETDATLVTAYVLRALAYAYPFASE